jgi:aminoglycoside 6'-N-acetyltransferase I
MRECLWPESRSDHSLDIDRYLSGVTGNAITLVAEREDGSLGGFLEAGTRPYAERCLSSPVGYVEGWWVDPELRRSGVGAMLVSAAESWARSLGLTEMASDTDLANEQGQGAHRALGYHEVERIVCYRKRL